MAGTGRLANYTAEQDVYKRKYRRLRKYAKELIFTNAALCDATAHVEEKTARVREERKFLLKKLFQCQSLSDASKFIAAERASSAARHAHCDYMRRVKLSKLKQNATEKSNLDSIGDGSVVKVYNPVEFDSFGRPLLPMKLGELMLHKLGQVDSTRPRYHSESCFFPPGFHSTRIYASIHIPDEKTEYDCKVNEGHLVPQFEVSVADIPGLILRGNSPDECHRKILEAVSKSHSDVDLTRVDGAAFFGLSHPTVLDYHQSFPNAKHCTSYRFKNFQITQNARSNTYVNPFAKQPTVSYSALMNSIKDAAYKKSVSHVSGNSSFDNQDESD